MPSSCYQPPSIAVFWLVIMPDSLAQRNGARSATCSLHAFFDRLPIEHPVAVLLKPIAEHTLLRFRAHGSGTHRIDAYSMAAELPHERLGQSIERAFRRNIGDVAFDHTVQRHRAEIDDPSAFLGEPRTRSARPCTTSCGR
jgi:hypothetical protein